jgi:hypothetical protein
MRTVSFIILFSVLMVVPSYAMTGNEWLAMCEKDLKNSNKLDMYEIGFCEGFLRGLRDTNDMTSGLDLFYQKDDQYNPIPKICLPREVTLIQLIKVVKKWYTEHPEKLHIRFDFQYVMIMREVYPCTENTIP